MSCHKKDQYNSKTYFSLFFAVVTALIVVPLWRDGYLFLLDWGIGGGSADLWQNSLLQLALITVGAYMPYEIFQKMLLSGMIFSLGVGGYLFARQVILDDGKEVVRDIVSYISGVFMIFNPFVYARLVDGQWYVVLGMICVLYMIIFLLRFRYAEKKKDMIYAILWATSAVMFLQHAIFFVLVVCGLFFIFLWKGKNTKNILLWLSILCIMLFFANLNIFVGHMMLLSEENVNITQFNSEHRQVFHTIDNGYASLYTNVLSLHGYWGEREDRFVSTQEHVYLWKPIFAILCIFIMIGVWHRRNDWIMWFFVSIGFVAYVLSMGSEGIFAPVSDIFYAYVPFYEGMREPHKWVLVLVICFDFAMLCGMAYVMQNCTKKMHACVYGTFLIIIIILYTPTMLWGFLGQVVPQNFPEEWYSVRTHIGCGSVTGKILFLPWHQYMKMDFLHDKKVANPARNFFGECVMSGDNIEARYIYTQRLNDRSARIEKYAKMEKFDANACKEFVHDMQDLSVNRIIMSKSEDFEKYTWITSCDHVVTVHEGHFLIVYDIVQ